MSSPMSKAVANEMGIVPITFEDVSNYLKSNPERQFSARHAAQCPMAAYLSHKYNATARSGQQSFSILNDPDNRHAVRVSLSYEELDSSWVSSFIREIDNEWGAGITGAQALVVLERIKAERERLVTNAENVGQEITEAVQGSSDPSPTV